MDLQKEVPVDAGGLRRMVDYLDHQGGFAGDSETPQRAKVRVVVERSGQHAMPVPLSEVSERLDEQAFAAAGATLPSAGHAHIAEAALLFHLVGVE